MSTIFYECVDNVSLTINTMQLLDFYLTLPKLIFIANFCPNKKKRQGYTFNW
jgi:hypothetical protein